MYIYTRFDQWFDGLLLSAAIALLIWQLLVGATFAMLMIAMALVLFLLVSTGTRWAKYRSVPSETRAAYQRVMVLCKARTSRADFYSATSPDKLGVLVLQRFRPQMGYEVTVFHLLTDRTGATLPGNAVCYELGSIGAHWLHKWSMKVSLVSLDTVVIKSPSLVALLTGADAIDLSVLSQRRHYDG